MATLVGVVAFLPFVRGVASGASLYFRDLAGQFFPARRLALEGLRQGEVPLWNPYLHEGIPLSLPAVGYPLDLLQLLRPDETGISLVLALHLPLAALGAYVLARRLLELPRVAAIGGAFVYALGGFVLSTVNLYVLVQAAAWAPLVVLTLARVAAGADRRAVARAAVVLAIALSTTGVEIVAQAVVLGLVLGLGHRERAWVRGLGAAGTSLGLATLLAAPVLVLVASQLSGSTRGQGLATDVVLAHSVHPFTLVQSVIGGLHGNLSNMAGEWWGQNFFPRGFPYILSIYVGAVALAVALVGARGRHPLRTRLMVLVGTALVVCLGRWAGLGLLLDQLSWLRLVRYPVKVFFTVHLGISLLVALGLSRLASAEGRSWRWLVLAAGAPGTLLTLAPLLPRLAPATLNSFAQAYFPSGLDPASRAAFSSHILTDAAVGGTMALAAAAVAMLVLRNRLPPLRGAILVVGLLGGDLLRTGSGLNPMVMDSFFRPSRELASMLGSLREGRTFTCSFDASPRYREARRTKGTAHELWTFAVALETLTPDFNLPLHVATALSPDRTMLVPEERVLSPAEAGCRNLGAILPRLRRAGVHAVLSTDPLPHPALRLRRRLRPARIAPLDVYVYEVTSPLSRFHVASKVIPVASASEAERRAAEPGFLEAGGAAVEGADPSAGVRGRIERVDSTAGRIVVLAETNSPSVLVVRDGWAPGWTARVNAQPREVWRADGRHMAVAIRAGRSEVLLTYRPPGLVPSLGISAFAVAVLAGHVWWRRRRP